MLLTLRHEWRLKCTEKYALDRLLGVFFVRPLFFAFREVDCTLFGASIGEQMA
jgi:hypothetical protein